MALDTTRIIPHLHQGSEPPQGHAVAVSGFTVLVLCAQEIQPPDSSYPGVVVLRCPLDDTSQALTAAQWSMIMRTAQLVAHHVRRNHRVLVTCQMGINRSGLVTAAALHILTGRSGCATARFVSQRRKVRRAGEVWHALSNERFQQELCERLPGMAR